jgi:hypothetical protein
MTTTLDIITRAFRKIDVSGEGETLTADAVQEGLDALNDMMHGWALSGVDVAHIDLDVADDFTLPPQYNEGAVYMLAQRLSPNYMVPAGFDSDDWMRKFQAAYLLVDEVAMPSALRIMPSQYTSRKRNGRSFF